MKQSGDYRTGVGASTILMILVVLALAALSLLSLNSARNNDTLSQRNLAMTLSYYEAAAEAQRMLAAMDALIVEHPAEAADATLCAALFAAHGLDTVTVSEGGAFSFSLDAGADRTLQVEGVLTPGAQPRCTLTCHELTSNAAPENGTVDLLIP
jgi:hypothetical protein